MKLTAIIALMIATTVAMQAQDAANPRFEVASVKPSTRTDGIREFQIQGGGRLVIVGMSVRDLVRRAYLASDAVQDETQITGGPSWVGSEVFDITATISDGDPGFDANGRPARLLAMLRQLLQDRFHLKVRTEPRETSIYDLVLVRGDEKPGMGLRASSLDCPPVLQGVPRPRVDPAHRCGVRTDLAADVVHVVAQGVTMTELATNLQGFRSIRRTVRDKTGLGGRFDFRLEFAPGVGTDAPAAPGIFTALQEQVGLKLQPAKGLVDYVVIESADRPAPN